MIDLVCTVAFVVAIIIGGYLLFDEEDWHR